MKSVWWSGRKDFYDTGVKHYCFWRGVNGLVEWMTMESRVECQFFMWNLFVAHRGFLRGLLKSWVGMPRLLALILP